MLCLPTSDDDGLITRVLSEIDIAQQSSDSTWSSVTVIVHTEDDDLFLPTGNTSISRFDSPNVSLATLSSSDLSATNVSNEMMFHDYRNDNGSTIVTDSVEESTDDVDDAEEIEKAGISQRLNGNKSKIQTHRFLPPRNLSSTFLERLMTITPLDYRYDVPTFFRHSYSYIFYYCTCTRHYVRTCMIL